MFISLLTTGIYLANATAFILLDPGQDLAQYISASSMYSLIVWTNLWIIPSTWGFDSDKLTNVRKAQFILIIIGGFLLIATHISAIGLSFFALLWLDSYLFTSFPLLYKDDTIRSQKIDLIRACLAVASLFTSVYFFSGSPTWYAITLVVSSLFMIFIFVFSSWYRPPPISWNSTPMVQIVSDITQSFRQRSLRAFILGRTLEVTTLLLMGYLNLFSALISFKLGLAISNTMSSNARRYRPVILFAVLNVIYISSFVIIYLMGIFIPTKLPKTLSILDTQGAILALPIVNIYLFFILNGIRRS
jgi:hypothetical protein